jgi:hypothetical protein
MKNVNLELKEVLDSKSNKVLVEVIKNGKIHISAIGENGSIISFEYSPSSNPKWFIVSYENKKDYYDDISEESWIVNNLKKEQHNEMKELLSFNK